MSSLQRVCEDHRMVEIVLVHGLRDRREDFSMLVEPLARFGQVSSPDAPGHVGPLDHPFCMIEWLEDVEQHISRTTEPPILFGLSAGGHIAMAAAARAPQSVRAVVACDTPMVLPRERLLSDEIQAILREDEREELVHYLIRGDLDTYFEGFPEDAVDPRINCPVLLVGGDESMGAVLTRRDIERALSVLPNAQGVVLKDVGHHLGIHTNSDTLMTAVAPFLTHHAQPTTT